MTFIEKIWKHRDAIAVSMVFCSGPLNYAIRDGIGVAPNSSIFSLLFMFGGIFLFMPFRNLNKLYRNDTPLTFLALVYLFMTIAYMFIYTAEYYLPMAIKIYDSVVIFIVLYFLFYLSTVPESALRFNFLRYSILIGFLGCTFLIVYAVMNPNFVVGQRLAISFQGESEMDSMGNPHIYGRGAFFGVISSLIYIKYESKKLYLWLTYFALVIFVAVLILSQAMSSILSGFGAIALFLWHNNTVYSVTRGVKKLFTKWYVWVIAILLFAKGIDFINKNQAIIELGYGVIERRLEKLANTLLPTDNSDDLFGEEVVTDQSAEGRVETLGIVKEDLIENFENGYYHKMFFGHGYYALYVDVPMVEVYHSYGLFGLSIFLLFFISMIKYCWNEMRRPTSIISQFVAYGFVYFFIFTFTNGLIIDYNRWTFFVMVCRFMPATQKHLTKLKEKRVELQQTK